MSKYEYIISKNPSVYILIDLDILIEIEQSRKHYLP
jgi:hypothetical protein